MSSASMRAWSMKKRSPCGKRKESALNRCVRAALPPFQWRAKPALQSICGKRGWIINAPSADRRHVHQAALVPQAVQATLEAERLEIGVEALAVVADLLHDVVGP